MSDANCIKVKLTEGTKPVEKIIVGMDLLDKKNGYELNNIIYVDYSLYNDIKEFPDKLDNLLIRVPQKKISERIERPGQGPVIIKSISINYNGFVYCGNSSTGHSCIPQSHLFNSKL